MHKRYLLGLLLALMLGLSGCWSRQEIENGGFATLMAVDRAEDGSLELTLHLAVPSQGGGDSGGGGAEEPVWTISATGRSLTEIIGQMRTFGSRHPFWFHAEALIIGEQLAVEGIAPVMDFVLRDRDMRLRTTVLIAEGKAKDILDLKPKITPLPSRYLSDLLDISIAESVSRPVTLLDLVSALVDETGTEAYVPLIKAKPPAPSKGGGESQQSGDAQGSAAKGDAPTPTPEPEALVLQGVAVLQGDRMVGKLNALETRGLLWLRGESRRATVKVEMAGGYVVQQQVYARRSLRVSRQGEQLQAVITINQDGDLAEFTLPKEEVNAATLRELDAALTAQIQREAEATLRKLQRELRVDVLGIGDRVYRLYPSLFSSLDWREVWPNLPVQVEVHANFRRTGEALKAPFNTNMIDR